MATPALNDVNLCDVWNQTKVQNWICCTNEATPQQLFKNKQCHTVDSFVTAMSNFSQGPCFTTGMYQHTVSGNIIYAKTTGGAYYTTKGGETYYTTNTSVNLVPLIDTTKVADQIVFIQTYTYNSQTIYCVRQNGSWQQAGTSQQPLLDFSTSLFRIKNGVKTYYDYKKDDPIQFLIDLHEYNIRNYIKAGNYFEIKGGTGYVSGVTDTSIRLMTPYCGVFPHTINMLTTLVSFKLIEKTLATCSLKNYMKDVTAFSNALLIPYMKKLIKQICKTYHMNWNNPEDKKMILFMIQYNNHQSPYLLVLFQNWYTNQFNPISVYALQTSVKVVFLLHELTKALSVFSIQMNDVILDAFYAMVFTHMFGGKKLTIKKLNEIFKPFANGNNIFSQHFCCIVRKWFGFIDETTDMIGLVHIEIGTSTMTQEELYNANPCPEHLLYYKNLLEQHFPNATVRVRLHQYIVDIGIAALEANGNELSDETKKEIIAYGLKKRLEKIVG